MRRRLVVSTSIVSLFAAGMGMAFGLAKNATSGFAGSFACENFGLPDKSYPILRIDSDLKVYGVSAQKKEVSVGRLQPRETDLAYFDISKETLVHKPSVVDPFANYIVDNAGDALLILEFEGERARMSYVCRKVPGSFL